MLTAAFLSAALAAPPKPAPKPVPAVAVGEPEPEWQATLNKVAPSVVVIRASATRAFDTEGASSSVATGFVVDAERGILLTNRHVVEPGPVVAEAVFLNHEEVPLRALYRDPVHDFGFYRFDPAALRHAEVTALPLEPSHAKVGVEIRVVGNDAGEKISILSGTLARLDRDAPVYGENRYNDFDTFYYQAASSTSGGSSGSPVVDVHGHVVALNAGGSTRAASSFYLPLDRVQRALELVRAGEPVPRGTVQAVLRYRPYDEVRRLGVRTATEDAARAKFPQGTGMLVVDQVVPGGPAAGKLEPGDVVVAIDGEPVAGFVAWESVLDDAVGREVTVEVERGGEPVTAKLAVGDLHAITPSAFLDVGGGVINPLSFQQARNHGVPVGGLYVAWAGYALGNAGIGEGAVITEVDGQAVGTLEALEAKLASYADGARVPVRFFDVRDPRRQRLEVVTIDRRWFPMQRCVRDDATGLWPCTPSPAPTVASATEAATTTFPKGRSKAAKALAPSLVWIDFLIPYRVEGVYGPRFKGTGVVVDADKGLVVTDRDTVPVGLGDVRLTFAGSVQVPGEVVWLHPVHNLAVVRYDPRALGDTPVKAAELAGDPLEPGDPAWHVGLTNTQEMAESRTRVQRVEALLLSLPNPPFFRDTNLDVLAVEQNAGTVGGVIADRKGRVGALWASFVEDAGDKPVAFYRGLPAAIVREAIAPLREGKEPKVPTLGVELVPVSIPEARDLGLSGEAAAALEGNDAGRRQLLGVIRRVPGTPAAEHLREGDVILSAAGEPVATYRDLDLALRAKDPLPLRLLRDGKEVDVTVPSAAWGDDRIDRVVLWAGAILHEPHRPVSAQRGIPPEGVYVGWTWYGSPAGRYGPRPTMRIVEVDGRPVKDLDAFLAAVSGRPDGGALRLKTEDLDGKAQVMSLKLDLHYWPTAELVRTPDGWERRLR
ncbi:MAG: trypsin-like peptidase domain-containing protein [Myxococcota bacterium]